MTWFILNILFTYRSPHSVARSPTKRTRWRDSEVASLWLGAVAHIWSCKIMNIESGDNRRHLMSFVDAAEFRLMIRHFNVQVYTKNKQGAGVLAAALQNIKNSRRTPANPNSIYTAHTALSACRHAYYSAMRW